jgi:hypothetical protein
MNKWRCHRRIIADYLVSRGEPVMHILGRGRVDRAELSAAARLSPTGLLIYDVRPGSAASRQCGTPAS